MDGAPSEAMQVSWQDLGRMGEKARRQDREGLVNRLHQVGNAAEIGFNVVYGAARSPEVRNEIKTKFNEGSRGLFGWATEKLHNLDNWINQQSEIAAQAINETWKTTKTAAAEGAEKLAVRAVSEVAGTLATPAELLILKALDITARVDETVSEAGAFIVGNTGEAIRFTSRQASKFTETPFNLFDAIAQGLEHHRNTTGLGRLVRKVANILQEPRDRVREAHHYGNHLRHEANMIRKGFYDRSNSRDNLADQVSANADTLRNNPQDILRTTATSAAPTPGA